MRIYINDQPKDYNSDILTIEEMMAEENIPPGGTAVAVNGKLVTRENWGLRKLQEGDRLTVISAAYGG